MQGTGTVYIDRVGGIDWNCWRIPFMIYLYVVITSPLSIAASVCKQLAVQVPSLQRLWTIAGELGLDFEKNELEEYSGEFFTKAS